MSLKYGWKPSLPDFRDYKFKLPFRLLPLPRGIDQRDTGLIPPPYDQLQLGACTGNGWGGVDEYLLGKEGIVEFTPSRLFIYFGERTIEGTVSTDSGAYVRDGAKALNRWGVPPETLWPYDITKFADTPPQSVYDAALKDRLLKYAAISRSTLGPVSYKVRPIKKALAAGYPVIFGFSVFESFETIGPDGIMPIPQRGEQMLGGHCVQIIGYKSINRKLYFICRNSWGINWGDGGYFYMPASIVADHNQSSDYWTASLVSAGV